MSEPIDAMVELVADRVLDTFVERVAEACASRMAPQRCPHCGDFVQLEADPVTPCPHCGTELVIFRLYDQTHVFVRAQLLELESADEEVETE